MVFSETTVIDVLTLEKTCALLLFCLVILLPCTEW
jgi:hypothetical protein